MHSARTASHVQRRHPPQLLLLEAALHDGIKPAGDEPPERRRSASAGTRPRTAALHHRDDPGHQHHAHDIKHATISDIEQPPVLPSPASMPIDAAV